MQYQEFIEETAEEEFRVLAKYKGVKQGAKFREYLKKNCFVSRRYVANDGSAFIGWSKK